MIEDILKTDAQRKLAEAFLELYAEKPLNKITVKELTSKAGLNRSTFYLYYNDIYAMLEAIEDGLIEFILPNIDIFLLVVNDRADVNRLIERINYCKQYQPYFKSLLGVNASASFINKVKTVVKNYIVKKIGIKNPPVIAEYIMEYIASAHLGVIIFWLKRDMDLPAEKMIELIRTTFLNGPYSVLKMHMEENILNLNQ